jgi:hypothetical protein
MLLLMLSQALTGQHRTIIEFYSEVPAVSDYIIDLKTEMTSRVSVSGEGWVIPPGHQVKIELPYITPNSGIAEIRLGFVWEGQVVSGTFEGWIVDRYKYRVFEENINPREIQKRIFPSMLGRGFEFRVKCNLGFRPERTGLILQSMVIYWASVEDD